MPIACQDITVLVAFTGLAAYIGLTLGVAIGYCARYGDYSMGYADGYSECFEDRGHEPPPHQR